MYTQTYTIRLEQFEGPFDLLLYFIQRDELDIYDIPIAKITDDFLEYIRTLEALDLDVASEFILVAATLIRIKSKMILPRREQDEEGNEIDPREELVSRLLEYKKYKESVDGFYDLEEAKNRRHPRGHPADTLKLGEEIARDGELDSLSLYKLMKAFERVMDRFKEAKATNIHTVYHYTYQVKEQRDFISAKVNASKKVTFQQVFSSCENRIHAIVRFLSMLEMLNEGFIQLISGEGRNNFWISKSE